MSVERRHAMEQTNLHIYGAEADPDGRARSTCWIT